MSRFSQTKFRNFVAHSYGFTLAEVLITLSILGVIAAITIPGIVRNFQDRIQITQFKKVYSMLENAMRMMYVIDGDPYTWDWPVKPNSQYFSNAEDMEYYMQKLAQYLPVERYCGTEAGCLNYGKVIKGVNWGQPITYNLQNGAFYLESGSGRMILKNDVRIAMQAMEFAQNNPISIGRITVDVNGKKGPNKMGYDVFYFQVDNKGIMTQPKSGCNNSNGYIFCSSYCSKTNTSINSFYRGISCSYWIMRHNNMDYKYRDVSSEW